jgi:hypothetical protein
MNILDLMFDFIVFSLMKAKIMYKQSHFFFIFIFFFVYIYIYYSIFRY